MKWLVTGGAGFIGSNLVEALVKQGERVRVVDNFITGKDENLAPFAEDIELITGDLRDPAVCAAAVRGVEIVLHQAALGSVPRSVADPLTSHECNTTATIRLLVAAKEAGVKRFVCASSSSVYGANPVLPKHEGLQPRPLSPYAVTKLCQEQYCLAFHAVYGLETVALRYFNIYGPRQDPDSLYAAVIPRFISAALAGRPAEIYGDGEQTRDFTYVADCVEANLLAAEKREAVGRFINIAGGGETSINQLWRMVAGLTGTAAAPRYLDPRAGDVRKSLADVSLARELLGWRPKTSLAQGLEQTVAWMKNGSPRPKPQNHEQLSPQ